MPNSFTACIFYLKSDAFLKDIRHFSLQVIMLNVSYQMTDTFCVKWKKELWLLWFVFEELASHDFVDAIVLGSFVQRNYHSKKW